MQLAASLTVTAKVVGLAVRGPAVPAVIGRALRIIAAHPAVDDILAGTVDRTGAVAVEIGVRLGLPNAWMADGVSPNGVRAVEPVTLILPKGFPLKPPKIYLRPSFNRELPHINPGPPDESPVPCIYDGDLLELLQDEGPAGILNQLVVWLENAALERLIDPRQGWEPVRRDSLADLIIANAALLRSIVARQEGYRIFHFDYFRFTVGSERIAFHGELHQEPLKLGIKNAGALFSQERFHRDRDTFIGRALAIFVWPGKGPSGKLVVADRYRPETVVDMRSLMERASEYGCATPLRTALYQLEACLASSRGGPFPIAIILCARRPFHLIASYSELELCPYVAEIYAPQLLAEGERTQVRPAGHHHAIAASLLRSMSGTNPSEDPPPWIQIGAGSLGSKIALHLARAGRAPRTVIDRSLLSPHNAARHALLPSADSSQMQRFWMGPKAVALARVIQGLGQTASAHVEDIVAVTRDPDRAKRLLPKKDWAVVNSTAALAVREALASVPAEVVIPRVIETVLYANGRVGLLSVEGPSRNPNTGDLITEAYALMREDPTLRDLVFASGDALRRQAIGEGCGSATMVMSDAQISMVAAPMAEALTALQQKGLPAGGRVLIGLVSEDGMSQSWRTEDVASWRSVAVDGRGSWHVRIAERAHQKMVDEVARWPGVETGGIAVGRFSEAAQTFYIVDVLPAPEDSVRSAAEFILGTVGVRASLKDYSESAAYSLYCLGTWHSHLIESGPSSQDRATATVFSLARPMPSVLLIHTPSRYRALLAEAPASLLEQSGRAPGTNQAPALNSSCGP